ncbi:hypothetical protein M422DRAFT_276616 [Sphaerobolus stellatus SS14]|uniref:Uncharacterized protein n=1 Tax=Sphaerobolus stellatus (strain SS14) TaxID=990650 RepID=A0A0C9T2C5_SPHS4|nr:hypothetical protein M422DRAFT_276616 [Sphaerobolus stellatus SS14]
MEGITSTIQEEYAQIYPHSSKRASRLAKTANDSLGHITSKDNVSSFGNESDRARLCRAFKATNVVKTEDDDEDLAGLPTIPEGIPQDMPLHPPTKLAHPADKTNWNNSKVVYEAGIPAIGGSYLPLTQKRIIADPPASVTGVLPKPLGKSQAEHWDQPTLRENPLVLHVYIEGRALQPHEQSPDHTVVIFHIDEYARSLPGLPRNLVACHDDPNWMTNVIQTFNVNPSGIPQNLQLEGLHINVDDADIWYWLNLIKPKYCGTEAETLLQSIFSMVGKWDQMITGQWKRNDSPFLCSPAPARYKIHCNQKFNRSTFTYWLGCEAGVTPNLPQDKHEPYFLQANEIPSLKGDPMNQFRVNDDLLPFMQEGLFYYPPSMGEPMDQDESDPEPTLSQPTVGSSSLANRLDYGEGGSFTCPPVDTCKLQGTVHKYTAELTVKLYVDNIE